MGSSLRIAMVGACPLPYPRGTPIRIARMSEALARRGHEIHVVTYHLGDGDLGDGVRLHRIPNVPTYRKLTPGPTYQKLLLVDPLLARELKKLLKAHPVDLIHAHHYEGLVISAFIRRSTGHPLIYDAHTLLASELPYYPLLPHKRLARRIGAWMDRRLPGTADHAIVVTEAIRSHLVNHAGLSPDSVTVVGNGVEWEAFQPGPAGRPPDPSGPRVITYAGNLAPYQGIEHLLEAVALLKGQGLSLRLVLVTETEQRLPASQAELARTLSLDGHVEVVRSDFDGLPRWLRQAEVLVNPRPACDGLPLKLLNYMAAGKPIVSFAGSAPGLVHGETAWLAQDGRSEALAKGVRNLLEDPEWAGRMGARARRAAEDLYSWDALAGNVEAVYHRVLAEATAAGQEASIP